MDIGFSRGGNSGAAQPSPGGNSPAISHKSSARLVVVLAFDGVTLSDIAGPTDVFDLSKDMFPGAGPAGENRAYHVVVASPQGGAIKSASGLPITTVPLAELACSQIDTLIVPGGGPPDNPPIPSPTVSWLRTEGRGIRRICSVCTGIFLLAEAGLADGRRVTTHWMAASALAARFPNVIVDSDPIFVKDGPLWSSAGFTAGIDLSLALIEEDFGHEIAIRLARALVMFIKRPGGQSQFSSPLASQSVSDSMFDKLHAWIMEHLADDLPVGKLADYAGMSPRTFARRYATQVGRTPAKTIEMFRLETACHQLTQTDMPLKMIARQTGFGSEQNMRRSFWRHLGVFPQKYRESFSPYGAS